jgi:hypothetical protein
MALVIADRVRETSTTTGTGTLTLGGAVTGFQSFSTAIGNTNTCYYAIVNGAEWEVGMATVGAGTLARTTVLQSSNADAAVDFSAGIKDVFVTYAADKAVFKDAAGNVAGLLALAGGTMTGAITFVGGQTFPGTGDVTLTGTQTLTNKTVEAGVFTNGYTEETVIANTSTAYTIDLANGSVQFLTLTGNCTYTFPTVATGKSFTLLQFQDATGSRTVTWPASVKWPAGTAPTITATASKMDKFVFTANGSYWYGSVAGQNF